MSAIPRPASTVVLMDPESRVYMTKRPESMKFMGGFYVFPGGAVEQGDEMVDCEFFSGELNHACSHAFYMAAARELFEEVGILLCQNADGSSVLLDEGTVMEYRRLLTDGEISFLHMLKKEGLQFDFGKLAYFGQIITPKMSPIRFDTRFFLAKLPEGQSPKSDVYEISDSLWISPEDALAAGETGKISLAPPTIHTLKTIINYLQGQPLIMPEFKLSDYKPVF
ncbi:NUDIX hydrolase [Neobacillus niacini]|uniref:NUDIX hydrolase n=1 Tax=Neobacillus niacini TaxID=86668 RepID=UPI0021CAFE96|nr:NUDIX hydrolase [Neobacillus niacini]MCM3764733.1 NUDIX hydrolase [Neobacillus niacini]